MTADNVQSAHDLDLQRQIKRALRELLPGGVDAENLLQRAAFLLELHAISEKTGDADIPPDPEAAEDDPRVRALRELLDDAIAQVTERSDRRLLRGVLGLLAETEGKRLKERRAITAEIFRGSTRAVSAATLRVHFEVPALDELSRVLAQTEVKARQAASTEPRRASNR